MIKHHYLALIFCFLSCLTKAQTTLLPKQASTENKGIIYNQEKAFNFKLHTTRGFAAGFTVGKIKTYYSTTYYNIELGTLKNVRESRLSSDVPSGNGILSRSYVYGKKNSFFALRGLYGQKRYFSEKAVRKGVAVGMVYEIGPSLGLVKPYYLDIRKFLDNSSTRPVNVSEKYSEENKDIFLSSNNSSSAITGRVQGASSFWKGINEISFIPGVHAKIGAHFDWGAFDEYVKAVEVGLMADVYAKKVPILIAASENRPYFINFYLALLFGKRT